MIFSSKALQPSPTSICEYPVRRSIIVSHAGSPDPLCQIFHFRASFRPHLLFAKQFCKDGWTPSGLPSVLNCVPIHNTGKNSWSLPPRQLQRSCIFLFAGNLPSGSAEGKENSPRLQRRRRPTTLPRDGASGVGRQRGAPFPFLSRPVLSAARRFFVAAVRPAATARCLFRALKIRKCRKCLCR